MFEYVDFLHFDFRGINFSNVRYYIKDYEYSATMIVVCLFLYPPIQSKRLARKSLLG